METLTGQQIADKGRHLEEERIAQERENLAGWKTREMAVMDMQREVIKQATEALASELHEDWRKTRMQEDGTFEPRMKTTKDEAWIASHGTDQVDIANTEYNGLPADWQAENKAASEVVVGIMIQKDGKVDLNDPEQRNEIGATIHDAWLARNEWARGGELDVPFEQLPVAEQAKDISQVEIAQRVFN